MTTLECIAAAAGTKPNRFAKTVETPKIDRSLNSSHLTPWLSVDKRWTAFVDGFHEGLRRHDAWVNKQIVSAAWEYAEKPNTHQDTVVVEREEWEQLLGIESCIRAFEKADGAFISTEERNRLKRLDALRASAQAQDAHGIIGSMEQSIRLLCLASTCDTLRSELEGARKALRDIWPFVEEDNGGFATPAYQRAIDGVRAALERKEEA